MSPRVSWQIIDEEDWSKSWKEHWQPKPLGDHFLITPAWLSLAGGGGYQRLVLKLDSWRGFLGTGGSSYTQLCLESLEMRLMHDSETVTIADIGCGSRYLIYWGSWPLLGGRKRA